MLGLLIVANFYPKNMETDSLQRHVLYSRVETALESIRPYLMADGGNVRVQHISQSNEVMLELLGACGTCPMSAMTLRAGVEDAIKRAVPEVQSVKAINGVSVA